MVRLDRAVDGVCIRVSDTGCGIDPSILPDLFKAFAQGDASIRRNHSGVGLGLALAARHVRRMGGRIDVDSRPGEGSTFILHLPLTARPTPSRRWVTRATPRHRPRSPGARPACWSSMITRSTAR